MTHTLEKAVALCRRLEPIAAAHGGHVALTGGTLYKDGERKDIDILIYPHGESGGEPSSFNWSGFFQDAAAAGVELLADYGWCKKASVNGVLCIDFFNAQRAIGFYPEE